MPTLYRTANAIVERTLKQADKTQLLFSALTAASVSLYQNDGLIKTLVLGIDPELRQGAAADKIELVLTTALLALLSPGVPLRIRWHTEVSDNDFSVDGGTHRDDQMEDDVFEIAA